MNAEEADGLPAVLVCALGGTIAMTPGRSGGVEPSLTAQALVDAVPGLEAVATVTATSFRQLPGAHLTVDDVIALAADLAARDGYAGYVVTQGTDTIEETAFVLDLLWERPEPLIVTGAMRNPTLAGADGPANVLAATAVAVDPAARGTGCTVVLNDQIHAGRFVQKRHTSNPAAFTSPLAGPLGDVTEGRPRFWTRPVTRLRLPPLPETNTDATTGTAGGVALLTVGLGDDGRLVRQAAELGYGGLVVEALGGGHVPVPVADALGEAASRMPVVLASRTGTGHVLTRTYGFPGSERDLLGRGLVPAGALDGPKARLLLDLLLRAGADRAEIAAAFDGAGGGGAPW